MITSLRTPAVRSVVLMHLTGMLPVDNKETQMYIERSYSFHCPECGRHTNVDHDSFAIFCRDCSSEVSEPQPTPLTMIAVAAYSTHRAYGGPEEGGWWYDEGERIDETLRCFEVGDEPQARLYWDLLHDRGCSSVRAYDRVAPSHFPARRPYYC